MFFQIASLSYSKVYSFQDSFLFICTILNWKFILFFPSFLPSFCMFSLLSIPLLFSSFFPPTLFSVTSLSFVHFFLPSLSLLSSFYFLSDASARNWLVTLSVFLDVSVDVPDLGKAHRILLLNQPHLTFMPN